MELKTDEQLNDNKYDTAQIQKYEDNSEVNNDENANICEKNLDCNIENAKENEEEINPDTNFNVINSIKSNYEAEDDEVVFVNTEKLNSANLNKVEIKEKNQNQNLNLNETNKIKEKDGLYESVDLSSLTKFDALKSIIEKQNKILSMTEASKEKLSLFEDMAKDQLLFFQHSTKKYGNYLKLIKSELFNIQDLIRKIKKEVDKK